MRQYIDLCQTQLHATLYIYSGTNYLTLHTLGTNLADVIQTDVTTDTLIATPPLLLTDQVNVDNRHSYTRTLLANIAFVQSSLLTMFIHIHILPYFIHHNHVYHLF